ncbi:nickel-dependent hydrogenase large subunit [Streptomyces sioyaensis]|uniref:nickel-dependent hydrogenase large subunit n=1 Tax=Streptomyces sioyaensis TaxID=67364 RepID=UPI00142EAD29|nr:nickel-dependent hydrogenase large subunit [Streptomyces sioyaensis]
MRHSHRIVGEAAHLTSSSPRRGRRCEFLVLQEQNRIEHVPTSKELADAEKYSWVKTPRYDYSPADRLRICVSGGVSHRPGEWADTAARRLEDQLAEIVQEVGLRGQAAERKRWLT